MLVDMDNRFLDWLSDADGYNDIEEARNHRFIIIHKTEDMEIDIKGKDTLEEVKKDCTSSLEERAENAWYLNVIFDLESKKEIKFKEIIKVEIEGLDF